MLLFCGLFFSSTLPNAGIERLAVALQLPEILAANLQTSADSGWRYFPQRFDLLATALFILSGAWGLGRLTLAALRVDLHPGSAEGFSFALGAGLSLWSLLTLGLGKAGVLSPPLFIALLVGLFLAGIWTCLRRTAGAEGVIADPTPPPAAPSRLKPAALLICAPFVLAMLLGAMLPSIDFDVKEYHLQGPKEHFLGGRIKFLPHNVYTSFPFLTEMLSLSAMVVRGDWFRGALAGKAVLMAFAPLTACSVFALTRRLFGTAAAWCAVVALLTTPWVYRISIIAYVEGGLCCYLALATLAFVGWSDRRSNGVLVLTGLFAGSAAACKYPGVLSVTIPIGVAALAGQFRGSRDSQSGGQHGRLVGVLRVGLLYSAGVLVAFGPWLLKNVAETGNPVYPLLWSVFGGESFDAEVNARWQAAHGPPKHLLDQPGRILPDLASQLRSVAIESDWQSPLLFALAPLTLLMGAARRSSAWLWAYVAWLFVTWLWLTHRIDRFWLPMVPLLAVLAGAGAVGLARGLSDWRKSSQSPAPWLAGLAGACAIGFAIVFNLGFITTGVAGFNGYLLDLKDAREQATGSSIRLLQAAEVSSEDRVLFVGEAAVFDADFPHVYNTVFDDSLFEKWFGEPSSGASDEKPSRPADEIRATLGQKGVTHVLVNWLEVIRYRQPGSYGFTDFVHPSRFDELVADGVLRRTRFTMPVPWENLSDSQRQEIERWAPELRGAQGVSAIELYEVVAPTEGSP